MAYLRAAVLAWLVSLSLATLSLWVTSYFSDYSRAVLATAGLVFGLYFLGLALQGSDRFNDVVLWLPFGRYNVYQALWGRRFPWGMRRYWRAWRWSFSGWG